MAHTDSEPLGSRDEAILVLGHQLNALLVSARAYTADISGHFDAPLSSAAFQILQWLHSVGPSRSMRIAEALAMDRGSMSRLLRQLTEDGFLEVFQDPTDKRVKVHGLTRESHERMECALLAKNLRHGKRLQDWAENDILNLARLLGRLNAPESSA